MSRSNLTDLSVAVITPAITTAARALGQFNTSLAEVGTLKVLVPFYKPNECRLKFRANSKSKIISLENLYDSFA